MVKVVGKEVFMKKVPGIVYPLWPLFMQPKSALKRLPPEQGRDSYGGDTLPTLPYLTLRYFTLRGALPLSSVKWVSGCRLTGDVPRLKGFLPEV